MEWNQANGKWTRKGEGWEQVITAYEMVFSDGKKRPVYEGKHNATNGKNGACIVFTLPQAFEWGDGLLKENRK